MEEPIVGKPIQVYRNKKTSKLYIRIDGVAVNATNSRGGEKMVLYRNLAGTYYVREWGEFIEKFDLIE